MAALAIDVCWPGRARWMALREIERVARAVARRERCQRGELSICVAGPAAMARLHQRYLRRRGPTDVLTFDLGGAPRRGFLLGEVVVCAAVARSAAGAGATLRRRQGELALYVIHGILHLAGYDDRTAVDSARMHAREDELLTRLGYGRVFAMGASSR